MGQVYQATDTKLNRQVALKILPEAFATDPDRLARFQREAQVLASLNHPNIAAIHGLEDSEGTKALVLELVEGPTLADRIAQGPIPIDEALPIAKQIAEALEAAHEAGVIHRDLKPANIKVRDDGTVKVLDFGLAKALDTTPEGDPSLSPTLTAAAKPVDKRADIWAFGAVLFEMLTGTRAFEGEDVSLTLSAVLQREPEWESVQGLPPGLNTYLKRCLKKDPRQRVRDIGDVRLAMDGGFESPSRALPEAATASHVHVWQRPASIALIAVSAAVIVGAVVWNLRPSPEARLVRRFEHVLPEGQAFRGAQRRVVTISPDGRHFAYNGTGGLYLRAMDESEARPIPGTEDTLTDPFFSPDGASVAYFQGGELRRISVTGGVSVALCAVRSTRGASWGRDDVITYAQDDGIWQVSANGGTPDHIVELEDNEELSNPHVLPGGEWLLLTERRSTIGGQIIIHSLSSGDRKVVHDDGVDARYVPTGHLVYAVEDALFAAPFDLAGAELTGGAVPVVQDLGATSTRRRGRHYSFSEDGSLVYVSAETSGARRPVWVTRDGVVEPIETIPAGSYDMPRLSPDDERVLVWTDGDAFVYDIASGRANPVTSDGLGGFYGEWDPTGSRVAYSSSRSGTDNVWVQPLDGSSEPRQLTELGTRVHVDSWSPDGLVLALHDHGGGGNTSMLRMEEAEAGPQREAIRTTSTVFSPDGRYVAYASDQTGQTDIYIRPYPGPGGQEPVSVGGAREPVWAANGDLFYRDLTGSVMSVVSVTTEPTLVIGPPAEVFQGRYITGPISRSQYDVANDGQRLLMLEAGTDAAVRPHVDIVLNWFEDLKRLAPVD
jgi:serine/threonine-protein kinase